MQPFTFFILTFPRSHRVKDPVVLVVPVRVLVVMEMSRIDKALVIYRFERKKCRVFEQVAQPIFLKVESPM